MLLASIEGWIFSSYSMGYANHGSTIISHLLFVDDTLLFRETDQGHIQSLKAILLCFEAVSSLKVNISKFELVAVGNICKVRGLASILGSVVSLLPMMYLSLPLGASFKIKTIWDEVLEMIEQ